MLFTLEKMQIDEGMCSPVRVGHRQTGEVRIFDSKVSQDTKLIHSVEEVSCGWQLLMGGVCQHLNTSHIAEILERGKGMVRFRTQTSVYELREFA